MKSISHSFEKSVGRKRERGGEKQGRETEFERKDYVRAKGGVDSDNCTQSGRY